MISRIILFLSLFTATSFIQTARTPFNQNPLLDYSKEIQQYEKQRKIFKKRGVALTATAPFAMALGTTAGYFVGREWVRMGMVGNEGALFFLAGTGTFLCAWVIIGGFVMLGFGISDLVQASAHKKLIKRLRLKEEAQERQRLRNTLTFREENN